MKPNEIYALPGRPEHWLDAVHLDVDAMFDRPPAHDWTGFPDASGDLARALPLAAAVKLRGPDQDDSDSEVRWTAWSWRGRTFGITLSAGDIERRYVTDPDAYGEAHLGLMSLHSPLRAQDIHAAGAEVDMDLVAGLALVRDGTTVRAVPARLLSDAASPLLDPDRLAEACRQAFDPRDRHRGSPGLADDALEASARAALLSGAALGTRRCGTFMSLEALVSPRHVGWVGLLVADGSGTYAAGLGPHDVDSPAGCLPDNVLAWRVGDAGLIDRLALDTVLEVGEEPLPPAPSP